MHQTRLDCYFLAPKKHVSHDVPHRNHFLDLPSKIRCQIYYDAGLIPNQYIDLNYWAQSKIHDELETISDSYSRDEALRVQRDREDERLDRHTSTSLLLPLHLLLVCKKIYLDLIPLVYSSNTFVIARHEPGSLGPLENIGVSALNSLRTLIVKLNDCSHPQLRKSTLGSVSRADKKALEQWNRICTRLSEHVPPLQLRLCIICDCNDFQTAENVSRISLKLPVLQDCAIRLSIHPDEQLKQLAKYTALRLTGRLEPTPDTFRFRDLPKEIQLHILRYTSLVAASNVEWSSRWPPELTPCICGVPVNNNMGCLTSTNLGSESLGWLNFPTLFLCSQKVSAFNPYCTYEGFQSSYFLVNHELRALATETFYKENQFIIFHKGRNFDATLTQAETDSLPLYTWLNSLPSVALGHLTKLSLVFPPFEPTYLEPSQGGWKCWIDGIEMLSRNASPEKLKLEIYFAPFRWYTYIGRRPHCEDRKYEHEMEMAYERVLWPLTKLRGLKCLGVHVPWPFGRTRAGERRMLEERLERNIMGEQYDGTKAGKSATGLYSWEDMEMIDSY